MTATDTTRPPAAADPDPAQARVGVFGIGLATYWPQFEGLKERIEGYQARVEERVRELGGEVVSAGLVDTEQGARAAGDLFASSQVDLVLCHAVTYATSLDRAAGDPGGEGPGGAARPAADARRSTTPRSTPPSGWPTARPAACRRSPAR